MQNSPPLVFLKYIETKSSSVYIDVLKGLIHSGLLLIKEFKTIFEISLLDTGGDDSKFTCVVEENFTCGKRLRSTHCREFL